MRSSIASIIAIAGLGWACSDAPAPTVTTPELSISYTKATSACSTQTARTISSQQADLYVQPTLDVARAQFQPVLDNCSSNLETARTAMLSYIQWTIDTKASLQTPKTGTAYSALITHWNTVFSYVGYTGADAPVGVPEIVLNGGGGVAGVITQLTGNRELRTPIAALTLPMQYPTGDERPHLFVIYPFGNSCLTGTNLRQYGPCYEFASFPHVSPKFDPQIKVGICQPEGPNHELATGGLGHLSGGFVQIPNGELYPTCLNAYGANEGSWTGGFGDVARKLASTVSKVFGPETAYAVHGGLGGTGSTLSPFGGVDLEVFRADFSNVTVGTTPDSASAQVGWWGPVTVTAPGTIAVQSSLGATTTATGNIVVLNQAGGACKNCGGLLLQGNLLVAPGQPAAYNGTYEATFIALQDNANMKSASFKLRDSGNNVLAQVTFTVAQNTNKVLFNGVDTNVRWVRHIPLSFTVDVNLDTHQATWSIYDPTTLAITSSTVLLDFMNMSTTNFTNISADFGGIDSGVMGWDEIHVVRLKSGN